MKRGLFGVLGALLGGLGIVAGLTGFIAPAHAEKRVALVVGNDNYRNIPKLLKAVNDAHTMGETLKRLGFTVTVAENLSRPQFSEALLAFDKAIEPGDTAFFFYSGHGFEIAGQNFLLPTDVPVATEGQEELVRDASILADRIVERLQNRRARTSILVFDACRNNPFERAGIRSISGRGGLAPMTQLPEGVFSVFSAGPRQTALDRLSDDDTNPNSVFTRVFAKELLRPGENLVQVAQRTRRSVSELAEAARHKQVPVYFDQMVDDVFLNGKAGDTVANTDTAKPAAEPQKIAALPPVSVPRVQTRSGGLGFQAQMDNGLVKVVEPIDGGPAAKAGIMSGDLISKIDGEAVQGMTLEQAVNKMKGPVDTRTRLTIVRKGVNAPLDLSITREIMPPTATFKHLPGGLGWEGVLTIADPTLGVSWRMGDTGDFRETESLINLANVDPHTLKPKASPMIKLPDGAQASTIEVRYVDAAGVMQGPFPIKFDPEAALIRNHRKMLELEMVAQHWLEFKDRGDELFVYYAMLIELRCAISEVHVGIDKAVPDKVVKLPPCDTRDLVSIAKGAPINLKLPPQTQFVSVKLLYRDGSASEVRTFRR